MIARTHVRRYGTVQYRARMSVANTEKRILEEIQKGYGGNMVVEPRKKASWRCLHQLVWTGPMVKEPLTAVGPHLRVKREQAAILLEFVRHVDDTAICRAPDGSRFATFPDDVLSYREALHMQTRLLNARGRTPKRIGLGKGHNDSPRPSVGNSTGKPKTTTRL